MTAEELAATQIGMDGAAAKVERGALAKYARLVSSASKGAVTDLF